MADIRIKDLPTTASLTASGDFIAIDGTSNGTRRLSAAAPAFLTSVTTPSLTSPAATALTLGTTDSGAAITVLAASNNVGIGTVSPSAPLHVAGSSGSGQIRVATDSAGTYAGGFGINASASQILSGSAAGSLDIWAGATGDIHFGPAAVTAMTLKSGGNVGIGTTTPTGARLQSVAATTFAALRSITPDTGNARLIELVGGGNYHYGVLGVVAGNGNNNGDAWGLGLTSGPSGAWVPSLTWSSGGANVPGTVSIASTTAGSAGAGALVLQGGISAGNTGSAASYFGGTVTADGTIRRVGTNGRYQDIVVDSSASYFDSSHSLNVRVNGASSLLPALTIATTGAATFAGDISLNSTLTATSITGPQVLQAAADSTHGYTRVLGTSTYGGTELYISASGSGGSPAGSASIFLQRSATNKSAWTQYHTVSSGKWRIGMAPDSTSNFYLYDDVNATYPIKVVPGAIGAGYVEIQNTAASTGVGTGALQVAGGIYAGAASVFAGAVSTGGEINATTAGNTTIRLTGGAASLGRFIAADNVGDAGYLDYDHATDSWILRNAGATTLTVSPTAATFGGAVAIANTVSSVSPTSPNRTITMVVGGVTLYIAAKTTND